MRGLAPIYLLTLRRLERLETNAALAAASRSSNCVHRALSAPCVVAETLWNRAMAPRCLTKPVLSAADSDTALIAHRLAFVLTVPQHGFPGWRYAVGNEKIELRIKPHNLA